MPTVEEAFAYWWEAQTEKGDPQRRPNLVTEAYEAGWEARGYEFPAGDEQSLSLRDRFAAHALGALHSQVAAIYTTSLRAPSTHDEQQARDYALLRLEKIGETAYAIADRMIAARGVN